MMTYEKHIKKYLTAVSVVSFCLLPCSSFAQPVSEAQEEYFEPPQEEIDETYFFEQLAPYGDWIWTPEHNWVWRPNDAGENWRPFTFGRWIYTDYGWTCSSYFPWGWAAFHYGSWTFLDHLGWAWVPGTVWYPARVMWRYSDVYVGWAPIMPGYSLWFGWAYFPVYYSHWVFIHWDHFCHHHPHRHYIHRDDTRDVFRHTYFPRKCRDQVDSNCRRGPSKRKVVKHSKKPVPQHRIINMASKAGAKPSEISSLGVDKDVLKIFRPQTDKRTISSDPHRSRKSVDFGPVE